MYSFVVLLNSESRETQTAEFSRTTLADKVRDAVIFTEPSHHENCAFFIPRAQSQL